MKLIFLVILCVGIGLWWGDKPCSLPYKNFIYKIIAKVKSLFK